MPHFIKLFWKKQLGSWRLINVSQIVEIHLQDLDVADIVLSTGSAIVVPAKVALAIAQILEYQEGCVLATLYCG